MDVKQQIDKVAVAFTPYRKRHRPGRTGDQALRPRRPDLIPMLEEAAKPKALLDADPRRESHVGADRLRLAGHHGPGQEDVGRHDDRLGRRPTLHEKQWKEGGFLNGLWCHM